MKLPRFKVDIYKECVWFGPSKMDAFRDVRRDFFVWKDYQLIKESIFLFRGFENAMEATTQVNSTRQLHSSASTNGRKFSGRCTRQVNDGRYQSSGLLTHLSVNAFLSHKIIPGIFFGLLFFTIWSCTSVQEFQKMYNGIYCWKWQLLCDRCHKASSRFTTGIKKLSDSALKNALTIYYL